MKNYSFCKLNIYLIVFVSLLFLLAQSVNGQYYFGKNKVQYTQFEWQVMTTDHFRIYFYDLEEEIAGIAAKSAEDSYRILAAKFNHEVKDKIPLVIYSSPNYFTQTNIVPGLLPESVAGFTEFMKGRVVLPFHGSCHDFDHVIRHELVHVFTYDKLESVLKKRSRLRTGGPPLWFTEGIAEFWSKEWDTDADMFVKDMVINNRFFSLPNMYQISGTYFMYKLGESICQFIDTTYGSDKLTMIFENWYKGTTFDEVVEITLGDNLEELSRKWEYSLKKKYFPEIDSLGLPDMDSRRISRDGYSVKGVPFMWDDGDGLQEWVIYKANRLGYSGIYMTPVKGPQKRKIKTLLKGERSSDFESLYLLRSGIDINDSGLVAFSSRSKENDVIYIYDLNKEQVVTRFELHDLAAARSPRFSSDGSRITFSGVRKSGFSDLFILDVKTGDYYSLTDDIYFDLDPAFSPDGTKIVFASDRNADGFSGYKNLYQIDLNTSEIKQLTSGQYEDQTPDFTEHGIYFTSDRNGAFNIFLLDNNNKLTLQSTYVTGAFDPRLSTDGTHLIYTGYQNMGFQVYQMELTDKPQALEQSSLALNSDWKPKKISAAYRSASVKYDADYSLDIAQSSIGYDPVYGSLGGFQVAASDVLGNKAYYFLLTNTADTKDDFFESFNVGVTYINREKRLNWGIGAYHIYDEYFNDFEGFFKEREAGIITLLSYPFSKFHRIELTSLAAYNKRDRLYGLKDREAILATNYLSWVFDNSLWDISGPIEGRRYNFTVGITTKLEGMKNFNRIALADIRHYFRLGRYSAFANRLFGYSSAGMEPQRIYFGGSWSFRGYNRQHFYTRKVLFASNELRFPLIDNLYIGFPFGGLGFSSIRGALFFDTGSAWDEEFEGFIGSFGAGFRVALGYLVLLRFDFTRTTDFHTISPNTDFDFFFGWNF